ncbi:AMP-binding protein [Nocardiopsis algeriensis]|uniref:Acetyl-CoA synthetase n=1 Tax=Nocardiopsis algeriensis TaxID=1478215 RepID=A0A841IR93_9ACTN|nr:AMP-binding protein [Nocardiopsis algeriensis]MBB6120744.1 acetyl-CoA synthetase [Nocardiopsis algeriensis]
MPKEKAAEGAAEFRAARDLLLELREDQEAARREFTWPRPAAFNWALDHFDEVARRRPDRTALWIVEENGSEARYSYRHLSERSNQVANWLHAQGVRPSDRILVMLGSQVELWEVVLAAVKLGAVVLPTAVALSEADLMDRMDRGGVRHVVCAPTETEKFVGMQGHWTRICVGYMDGWLAYPDSEHTALEFYPPRPTAPDDPLLMYFTSGTTAKPKLVTHTQHSYPVGHLSTMYWLGVQPGDVHLNVSPPGWGKHAYGSVFGPWNAEATVLVVNQLRFRVERLLDEVVRCGVDTLCMPPTVWRMLLRNDLASWEVGLREALSAGEPLAPDVLERVHEAWGIPVRDGFGQTETTMIVGNGPGQPIVPGSMGRELPGFRVEIVSPDTDDPAETGELCVDLAEAPVGVMRGYTDDGDLTRQVTRRKLYHTRDMVTRGPDGQITYVGRFDDVFKASDYRISPFEIESVLVEHEYVAEAAVVPSPDPLRGSVVKAYVSLREGVEPGEEAARAVLAHARGRLSPYKRVRRLEFAALPKSVAGKIRRVQMRRTEAARGTIPEGERHPHEYWEEDLPGLGA